jgi:ComF family protein
LSEKYATCDSCKSWLPIEAVYVSNPLEGIYAEMIKSFKFDCKRQISGPIAKLMVEAFQGEADVLLCPVPTASSRIRERGFDHTKLLAKEYQSLVSPSSPEISFSLRRRSNVRQLGSSRAKRIEQMKQEFYIIDSESLKDKDILLLDDVVTTGASLAAAAKTLKKAGARRITAVIFAQKV